MIYTLSDVFSSVTNTCIVLLPHVSYYYSAMSVCLNICAILQLEEVNGKANSTLKASKEMHDAAKKMVDSLNSASADMESIMGKIASVLDDNTITTPEEVILVSLAAITEQEQVCRLLFLLCISFPI